MILSLITFLHLFDSFRMHQLRVCTLPQALHLPPADRFMRHLPEVYSIENVLAVRPALSESFGIRVIFRLTTSWSTLFPVHPVALTVGMEVTMANRPFPRLPICSAPLTAMSWDTIAPPQTMSRKHLVLHSPSNIETVECPV